jgi:hypothetical protein
MVQAPLGRSQAAIPSSVTGSAREPCPEVGDAVERQWMPNLRRLPKIQHQAVRPTPWATWAAGPFPVGYCRRGGSLKSALPIGVL